MIEWINACLFLVLPVLCAYYYAQSVSMVQMERKIGPDAYKKCERYRILSLLIFIMIIFSYILYYFYPLPVPIPQTFPIIGWIIAPLASLLLIPLGYIYYRGVKDAGEETMHPRKEGELYGGIYGKIRHPQALALLPVGWILGFILNSPFLVIISFIWVPAFYLMCLAEEKDLLLRYGDSYSEYMKNTGFFIPKLK